jgi:hypothetical protein
MARGTIAFALILAAASPVRGQGKSPHVDLILPEIVSAGSGVASTTMTGILTQGNRRELLNGGFPVAIHGRLELWRKGRFVGFDLEADFEWDVIVQYLPASKQYVLRRIVEGRTSELGEVSSIEAAEQLLRQPFSPPLSPERHGGRYFYVFNAEVSALSLSDLEAWNRWVRGEAQPAVRGKRNPGTALQRGLGSLLSRMLGGDTQSYDSRSSVFTAG